MKIGAVIVAAGMSTRAKEFKQLMKVGNMTLAERVVVNFQQAGIHDIVMVVGHRSKDMIRALKRCSIVFLENEDYETTEMFDSAKIGMEYLKDRCDKIFFCPADVSFFSEATIKAELEADAKLVVPITDGKPGHPILIDSSLIPEILEYKGQGGLKGALDSLETEPYRIDARDEGSIVDADTKGVFNELVNQHNKNLMRPVTKVSLANTNTFFDPETKALLKQIDRIGNVRDACERCGISYSKAWKLIRLAEEGLGYTLVARQAGGKNGGFAEITDQGLELIDLIERLETEVENFTKERFREIFKGSQVLGDYFDE